MNELAIKMAIETTTSCQLVQNFLVCAVETYRLHKLKSFGLIGRHSKLYCLCSRDIQNFIVCAIATFKTLSFVQSRHSKLYCLCNRDIQNFVCAIATFKTLLFVQSSHSKLFSLRVPSGAPYRALCAQRKKPRRPGDRQLIHSASRHMLATSVKFKYYKDTEVILPKLSVI